ncbi:MAG: TonB-dependent receptor, partial [Deltaproteobacteria bacterium]|nr:TonB-dependent receptor [Deltaproteobacteria bacterium]
MCRSVMLVLLGLLVGGPAIAAEADLSTAVMDEVVVTATRMAEPLSKASASVGVVTAEEIAARGATRLDEVLQDVVGLHVVSSGPAGSLSSASIRGSEASQVLVLIDGVRLNSPQYGQFDLNQLPVALNEIDRIEVLRGAASALYGSNALGGVINIITRSPKESPSTQVAWTEGERNTRIVNGSTSRQVGNFRYRLGAGSQESDGYRKNSDYDQYTVNGLFGYSLAADVDLELSAYHLDYDSSIPGSEPYPSPNAEQEDKRTVASVKLEAPVGPFKIKARGIYEHHRNDYENPDFFVDETHKIDTYGAELHIEKTGDNHTVLMGADYYNDELDSTNIGDEDQEHGAFFGQFQTDLPANMTLLLGLRYDIHSDFDNELSPRAALHAALTDSTRVRLSASKAFRAPTLNDLYWPTDFFSKGNPDLDPETAWEYELALDQTLSERGRVSLAGFLRDAKDLISWQPDEFFVYSPVNVNDARIWGVEIDGQFALCSFATIGGNYTYLHPKDRDTDEYLLGKPRHETHGFVALKPC